MLLRKHWNIKESRIPVQFDTGTEISLARLVIATFKYPTSLLSLIFDMHLRECATAASGAFEG